MQALLHDELPRLAPDPGALADNTVLEIGCGNGAASLAYAARHPDATVIAADVHKPGIAQVLATVVEDRVPNVQVYRGDAVNLLRALPDQSLCAVHLFFPDPWPKRSHHKRRFVRGDLVALIHDRLQVGGSLLVATDAADYAAAARETLDGHPGLVGGPAPAPDWRPATTYSVKAEEAGRTVTDLAYRRLGNE